MKDFTATTSYPVTAAQVREVQLDEGFVDYLAQRFASQATAEIRALAVHRDGPTARTELRLFIAAADLPQASARFLPGGVEVTILQRWDAPTPDGKHTGELHITTNPDKVALHARFTLEDTWGGRATRTYKGQLAVKIPLLGGMLEGQAVKNADRALALEAELVSDYLKEPRP